ncbi:MAG: hypothetical protein ACFFAS_07570 [Promethearchaeota archaeon]
MDPTRLALIYVVYGLLFVVMVYLSYKILTRDKKRLNQIFSGYYISVSIGLIFNFIYAPFGDAEFVRHLNYLTNLFVYAGVTFLVVFNLMLLKSEKIINTTKQLIILISSYLAFGIGMLVFNLNQETWVTFNPDQNYSPVWSPPFFLYVIILYSLINFIPILYTLYKIRDKFTDKELKKKWIQFSIGTIFILAYAILVGISNLLDISIFRTLTLVIAGIMIFSGVTLTYLGVGRQLSK